MNQIKTSVILVNLGSPDELSLSAIRKFLKLFLKDQRVVRLPKLLWYPILYGIILPFRAKKLIKQYQMIWQVNQSPLVLYTNSLKQKVQKLFSLKQDSVKVDAAFCYSTPSLETILKQIATDTQIENLFIVPLYPQFSSTTTMPVFDQLADFYRKQNNLPNLNLVRGFATHPRYIEAIANSIKSHWQKVACSDKLIFSFHSLPKDIIKAGDPYYQECLQSAHLIAANLGLDPTKYEITFQSKFGYQKWLEPSTQNRVKSLALEKVASIDIVCPGFVCDCLETLEEIAILNKQVFLDNGGKSYNYIACLNDSDDLAELIVALVKPNL